MKWIGRGFLMLFGFMVILAAFGPKPPPTPPSPEQLAVDARVKAAKDKIDREQQAKLARDPAAIRQLESAMHDPDSFRVDQALRMDNGALCITYRARNGFNAVRTGHALVHGGKIRTSQSDGFRGPWNQHGGGKSGESLADIVRAL